MSVMLTTFDPAAAQVLPHAMGRPMSHALATEAWIGFSRPQRELPAAFLVDREVADIRRALETIEDHRLQQLEVPLVSAWASQHRADSRGERIIELMPDGGTSTHALLDRPADLPPVGVYLAIATELDLATEAADRVRGRYPEVVSLSASSNPTLELPVRRAPATTFAMLGGALGRFMPVTAVRVLRALRAVMSLDDHLLLGIDLRPLAAREASRQPYVGLLDQLHQHALRVANRTLGADFPVDAFQYACRQDDDNLRLEEGLRCERRLQVSSPRGRPVPLRAGELVRTGVSCHYARPRLSAMLRGVGLHLEDWRESPCGSHALADVIVRLPDDGVA
jgi:L-histidine Nalpha-methyltransferase